MKKQKNEQKNEQELKDEIKMYYAMIREFKIYQAELEYLFYTSDNWPSRNALNSAISLTSNEIERIEKEIYKLKEA